MEHVVASPAAAARETVEAMGLIAETEAALRDIDHGSWIGRGFAEIHAENPDALAAWLADPLQGAPGGESMAMVRDRVGEWLARQADRDAPILAITHPMVVRAALASALGMPLEVTLRIDVAPLSTAVLSFNRVWRLQALR